MLKRVRDRLQEFYEPPAYQGDPEQVRRARLLYTILTSLTVILSLLSLSLFLWSPSVFPRIIPLLAVIPFVAILRRFVLAVRADRISFLFISAIFAVTFVQTLEYGGVQSPAFASLFMLAILTGLLLGFRSAVSVAAASLVGGGLLNLLDQAGFLPPSVLDSNTPFLLTNAALMLVAIAAVSGALRDTRQSYQDGQRAMLQRALALDKLAQRESHYRSIVEDQTELVNRYDRKGTILFVNEAYARLYNLTPGEMIGRNQREYLSEQGLKHLEHVKERLTPESPVTSIEYSMTDANGEELVLEWRDRLILDEQGQPIEYQGVGRDVTVQRMAERALLESEEKFRTLSEKSPNMIFINQGGKIIYANEACVEVMGYSLNELYADDFSFQQLIAPESLSMIREYFERHARGEEVPPYEADLVTKDGRRIIGLHSTRLILISGRPAILGIITDVTARRASEEALIRLNKAVESSGEVVFMTDPKGVLTYANAQFTQVYGYTPEEVIGQATPRILNSGLTPLEVYEDFWTRILRGETVRAEFINRTRAGQIVPVEVSVNPIVNEAGEITGFLAAQRDISERKSMEEELRKSEELYRAVAESAFVGIAISDAEETLTYVNPTFAQMLGYSQEEMLGRSLMDFMDDAAVQIALRQSTLRKEIGNRNQYALPMLRKDGSERLMQISASPLLDESGNFENILAVVTDITEQRAADRELRRQVDELSTLQSVASACSMSLDEDEIIERVTQVVSTTFYPDHVGVLLMEGDRQSLRVHPSYHGLPPKHYQDVIPVGSGVTGSVVLSGLPVRVADVRLREGYIPSTPGILSELCVPLISGGQVLGTINAESLQPGFFSEDDERLLLTVANLLATTIQNARLFRLAQDQRIIAEALREASMALSSTLDFNRVLEGILASLGRVVPHDAANIMTLDTDGRTLRILVSRGLDDHGIDEGRVKQITLDLHETTHLRRILDTKEPFIISDVEADPDWVKVEGMEWLRSYLCAPIVVEGTVIGFVNLDSATPDFFKPSHARDLAAFATHAAVAIENAMLYQELERHSQFLEQAVEEATSELRQSSDRVETILENSPDAVLLLKRDGTIELSNAAFSSLFGYTESEVRGQSLSMLAVGEEMGRCNQHLHTVVEQMVTDRFEIAGENKAGTHFDAEFALAPITREGELFGVVSTIRDISALKQIERMKDAFVSNVSHELRTPITSLKLNHSLLEMNPTRSGVYLERIGREIDRLNELIEDLLRLSRLEQGKVELNLEQVSMGVIAGEYAKDRMPLANDRKISLFLEDDAKTDLIYADPGLVGQALSVLLTNALNYTPPGGQIMVRTLTREGAGEGFVGVEVYDTGPGIDEQDLPLIFERFFRGKTGLESRAPGTGLGLAIAQEIVKEHGGKIEVDPGGENGQGASFKLWFPALPGKTPTNAAELGQSS